MAGSSTTAAKKKSPTTAPAKGVRVGPLGAEGGGSGGFSVSSGDKKGRNRSFSVKDGNPPTLEVTNEYGNSVSYSMDERGFDGLWSQLWQFVKDSQH